MERISASLGMINVKERAHLSGRHSAGADAVGRRGKCLAGAKAVTAEGKGERNNFSYLAKDGGRPETFLPSTGELSFKKRKRENIFIKGLRALWLFLPSSLAE